MSTQRVIKRKKIVNDAVFGSIELSPICVQIIDTPEFQRLRYIKQLSGAVYVYPTANHSRFQHSIGVYHVAKQMVEKLKKKHEELLPDGEESVISDRDVLCVSIAALCHDLGHGPFSHVWQIFMNRFKPDRKWKHETTSVDVFNQICNNLELVLKNQLTDDEVKFIGELIHGVKKQGDNWICQERQLEESELPKIFLYEIVANKRNGLDVDKFAYLTQDSHYLGIKTSFDYARVIEMAQVLKVDGEYKLCYKKAEEINLYYTFLTRWNLHRRAYRHRVTRMIEKMLVDAFQKANSALSLIPGWGIGTDSESVKGLSTIVDELDTFLKMNDENLFHGILNSRDPKCREARELFDRIHRRKLYKQIAEKRIYGIKFKEDTEQIKQYIINYAVGEEPLCKKETLDKELDVDIQEYGFGMKGQDPMKHVDFYDYGDEDEKNATPKYYKPPIAEQSMSTFLSPNVEEWYVSLIWMPEEQPDAPIRKALKRAFEKWCA